MKISARMFVFVVLISGCASNLANVQRQTAISIGGDVAPDNVIVRDMDRGMMNVKWNAETPKGKYSCSADDMMRKVLCVKVPAKP